MGERDELLGQMDELIDGLYERLRAEPAESLSVRPAPEVWSVVENVRHLLYAEERHIGRLYLEDFAYTPIGVRPDGQPRASGAGSASTDDIEEVLSVWAERHRAIRAAVLGAEDPVRALNRNLTHLRTHVRVIGRLLDGDEKRTPRRRSRR